MKQRKNEAMKVAKVRIYKTLYPETEAVSEISSDKGYGNFYELLFSSAVRSERFSYTFSTIRLDRKCFP